MRIHLSELPELCRKHPDFKLGCITDTNAMFARSMDLDRLNTWADAAFDQFAEMGVPVFTNINIRSEFMELQRRVMVPEGLVTFYEDAKKTLPLHLVTQLKSLTTAKQQAADEEKLFKFNDQQMKKYRALLFELPEVNGLNGWERFCLDYLHPYLSKVWDLTLNELAINFVGTRAIESRAYFDRDPSWKDMTDIMGRFGVGSADAMIINCFLCSKFPLIVTGDEDVAYVVERMSDGSKYVLVPEKGEELLQ